MITIVRMQQMEKLYAQDPSDALVLGEYLELLEEYLKRKTVRRAA